jgi:hypothetical protein
MTALDERCVKVWTALRPDAAAIAAGVRAGVIELGFEGLRAALGTAAHAAVPMVRSICCVNQRVANSAQAAVREVA